MKYVYAYILDPSYQVELYSNCMKSYTNKKILVTHTLNFKKKLVDNAELYLRGPNPNTVNATWDGWNKQWKYLLPPWSVQIAENNLDKILRKQSTMTTLNLIISKESPNNKTPPGMFALDISIDTALNYINFSGGMLNFSETSPGKITIQGNSNLTISGFQFQNVSGQLFDITDSSVSLTNITISGGQVSNPTAAVPGDGRTSLINILRLLPSYKVVSSTPTFQSHPSSGNPTPTPPPSPTPTPMSPSMSFKDIIINDIQSDNSANIIELTGNKINVKMSGVNIRDNSISGSCIKADNDLSLIDASITFSNNKTTGDGAAICSGGSLTISGPGTNLKFYDNSANFGGAIFSTSLTIQNTSGGSVDFCGNQSDESGGAMSTLDFINLIDASIIFSNNISQRGGGGLFILII